MDVRLRGIVKSYEGRRVLSSVDLDIPSGGIVVLEGINGSGKTTLMEVIAGLVEPDQGEVRIGGKPAAGVPPDQRGVFYVPQSVHKFWALQDPNLLCYLPSVSVRENLEEAARRDEKRAEEFLRLFGLFAVRASDPAQLSRGQKQRLALARAFLSQEPIVLLDEPLASIDPSSRQDLLDTIVHLQRRYSRTMLFVTQHPDELRHIEAHRLAIRDGELGPPQDLRPPLVERLQRRVKTWSQRVAAITRSSALPAEVESLRREMQVLRAAVEELQRAPAAGPAAAHRIGAGADVDAMDTPEPRRIMRRRQAPWIDEPLSEKSWRPEADQAKAAGPVIDTAGQSADATVTVPMPAPVPAADATALPLVTSARRTLILRCPSLFYNYHGIPPFGLATIVAALRSHGQVIHQDDLDAKCAHAELFPRHRWGKQFPAKSLMMDIVRMRRHWETGQDADVIDLVERVLAFADLSDVDTVALSCIEGDDYAAVLALNIGKYLRERLGKTVIVGGEAFPHMQPIKSDISYFYERGCFDYYIQGYGEVPLLELFRHLDANNPVAETPGLVSLLPDGAIRENRPLFTRAEVVPDFEGLPIELYYKKPDEWDEWKKEDAGVEEILVLPFKTNFCCPNKCAFCIQSGDTFTKVSCLTPERIVTGLAELKRRYRTSYFMFADDMFNVSARWAESVADAMIAAKLDVMWSDCAFGRDVSAGLLQKLRKAGAVRLVWGMESGSPRLQKLINKNLDLDELSQILRWSHEAGIYNAIQVIAGLPTETAEDVEMTVEFLRRNRDHIDQVYLNPFSLITGSLMHGSPERFGLTNVRPVATIFQATPDAVYSWIQRFTFDTDDMSWAEKVKQIENAFRRLQETVLDLDLGGHDIHTLMLRFARYGDKRRVKDFQSARRHQGFEYFGDKGKGHSPDVRH